LGDPRRPFPSRPGPTPRDARTRRRLRPPHGRGFGIGDGRRTVTITADPGGCVRSVRNRSRPDDGRRAIRPPPPIVGHELFVGGRVGTGRGRWLEKPGGAGNWTVPGL